MKSKSGFLAAVFAVVVSIHLHAQLTVANKTSKAIQICIGWYEQSNTANEYVTKGWWTIEPGMSVLPGLTFTSNNDYFYYYAKTTDEAVFWEGETKLLTSPDAFLIHNADKPSTKDANPSYQWKLFTLQNVTFSSSSRRQYTLEIQNSDIPEQSMVSVAYYAGTSGGIPINITLTNNGNDSYNLHYYGTSPINDACTINLQADGVYSEDTKQFRFKSDGCLMIFRYTDAGDLQLVSATGCEDWGGPACSIKPATFKKSAPTKTE